MKIRLHTLKFTCINTFCWLCWDFYLRFQNNLIICTVFFQNKKHASNKLIKKMKKHGNSFSRFDWKIPSLLFHFWLFSFWSFIKIYELCSKSIETETVNEMLIFCKILIPASFLLIKTILHLMFCTSSNLFEMNFHNEAIIIHHQLFIIHRFLLVL